MIRTLIVAAVALTAVTASAEAATKSGCSTEAMPPDMFQSYVQGTQQALTDHGFKPGAADGKMGAKTRSAIRSYQQAAKLRVDGCVSKELLDHLNFATPKVYAGGKRG